MKRQSRSWSQRGTKKVNGSHRSDNSLLRPTGIQIATKPPVRSNQPITSETCRRQDNVFGYELRFLLSGFTKVIKSESKKFSGSRRVTRRQVMRHFTSHGTDQCQDGSSNLLTLYREQSRSTRIVVAYPRSAFSATKLTNHASIGFNQQAQVSQRQTSCRNEKMSGL